MKSCIKLYTTDLSSSERGGGAAEGATPGFGRSVNPVSTKEDRLCPPNNTGTSGFSDLPTVLHNEVFNNFYFNDSV